MLIHLLEQVALLIIIFRSIYVTVMMINRPLKNWMDILFHASIAIVALSLLL